MPGTVVVATGTVGTTGAITVGTTVGAVTVGRSPSVVRVVKDPPPPASNMAVVIPGTVVVGTGATAGTVATGATKALKGKEMVRVDGGATVGTRVVTLNPAGVTAGGVVKTGTAEGDGVGRPNKELSRT
jgi:hypothetical protein